MSGNGLSEVFTSMVFGPDEDCQCAEKTTMAVGFGLVLAIARPMDCSCGYTGWDGVWQVSGPPWERKYMGVLWMDIVV